jgi:hypothetical protein
VFIESSAIRSKSQLSYGYGRDSYNSAIILTVFSFRLRSAAKE